MSTLSNYSPTRDPLYDRFRLPAEEKGRNQHKEETPSRGGPTRWAAVVLALPLAGLLYLFWGTRELSQQLRNNEAQLSGLIGQLQSVDEKVQLLEKGLAASSSLLNRHGQEISRSKTLVSRVKSEQEEAQKQLQEALSQKADVEEIHTVQTSMKEGFQGADQRMGALKGDMASLQTVTGKHEEELGAHRTALQENRRGIQEQSDSLAAFKRSFDRWRVEFELDKGDGIQKISGLQLKLTKTDPKKGLYELEIYSGRQRILKKNRSLNEPIFLYLAQHTKPYEVVATKVGKTHILGYVTVPSS